ncbi:MAG: glycoside hydrolase family 55 protein [bacterium]|nr:glycoside hydrolase family 55 protein [bacterium]
MAQTTFAVTFQSAGDDEIVVYLNNVLVSSTLYTFNRDPDGTGEVIFATAVTGQVDIVSSPAFDQPTSFSKYGAWDPSLFNTPLDKGVVRDLVLKIGVEDTADAIALVTEALDEVEGTVSGLSTTVAELSGGVIGSGISPAQRRELTATAAQTSFSFLAPALTGYVSVYLNGVLLAAADYTFNGTSTITLASGAAAGDTVILEGFTQSAMTATYGDVNTVATRTVMAGLATAAGYAAYLTEAGREGAFVFSSANLSTQVTADAQQGVYVAPTAAPTGAGGAWVRKTKILTPYMFGAVGNGTTDDTVALQAFFDDARINGPDYVYDRTGKFLISNTIYVTIPHNDANQIIFNCVGMMQLKVAPLASLPGGLPLDYVLEITGNRQEWTGRVDIHNSGASTYGASYATRRFKTGVRTRYVNASVLPDIYVDDAKRDAVYCDSSESGGFTVRSGALATTYVSANNIGAKFGRIYARLCGSTHASSASYGVTTPVTLVEHGGTSSGTIYSATEAYTNGSGGYGGSTIQRSRLTVGSTADMEILDLIRMRVELTPTIYGTIAYSNALSRITWTAGDPTTYLAVGEEYPIAYSGANSGGVYRITSFSGTSNREINVTPAPVLQAAGAVVAESQYGAISYHTVSRVHSATQVTVFPWVSSKHNSVAAVVHGAAFRVSGGDTGNVSCDSVKCLASAIGYWGYSLYGPEIGTVLVDYVEIGLRLSAPIGGQPHIGLEISHAHLEGAWCTIFSQSALAIGRIHAQSAFSMVDCLIDGPRTNTTDLFPSAQNSIGEIQLFTNGMLYESALGAPYEGYNYQFYPISNSPDSREVFAHVDSLTIEVTYDYDAARLFAKHHWARLIWTDADGTSPDGTLTLTLNASLSALGWRFAGASSGGSYSIVAPSTTVILDIQYLRATKRVVITRTNGAAAPALANSVALTASGPGITATSTGSGTYTVTTTAASTTASTVSSAEDVFTGDYLAEIEITTPANGIWCGFDNLPPGTPGYAGMDECCFPDAGFGATKVNVSKNGMFAFTNLTFSGKLYFTRVGTTLELRHGATWPAALEAAALATTTAVDGTARHFQVGIETPGTVATWIVRAIPHP